LRFNTPLPGVVFCAVSGGLTLVLLYALGCPVLAFVGAATWAGAAVARAYDRRPLGWIARERAAGALLCLACGAFTLVGVWGLGYPNVALLGAFLWCVAALGIAANIVAFRTIYYLPTFTAGVAVLVLWKNLYNPETGPINVGLTAIFGALGLEIDPPRWLGSVAWAKPALIMMGIWTTIGGTNMLLYLAGLSNVPRDLLDAAEVDGAGAWAKFRHVTWPQLAPTTFFITVMSVIGGLQGGFQQARVMTQGGPEGSTTTLSYYVYQKLFLDAELGYAAAISWVLFAVIFAATAINWRFGRELEVVG
jgi:multiple sugar transport system permease protein